MRVSENKYKKNKEGVAKRRERDCSRMQGALSLKVDGPKGQPELFRPQIELFLRGFEQISRLRAKHGALETLQNFRDGTVFL